MKTTNANKLWITAIFLGWLLDFLFWKQAPGINFAIFSTFCLIAGLYLLLGEGLKPAPASLILLPLFVFFAVSSFVRAEPMTTFLSVVFTLFTLGVLAVTYLGGKWIQYNILNYIVNFINLIGSMIARPITYGVEVRNTQTESGEKKSRINIGPVLRGVIIALPIVAIFASLLASADVVFDQKLANFIELFKLENLPEYIFRLIYILGVAYALAGTFLHSATQSKDEKMIGEEKPLIPAFLGFIESYIVLSSVVFLFAMFVIVQFQYFFGGHTNIRIEGFTYSEYARRGFGELVAVAFFSLLMLLSLSAVTRRETESQRKIYSGLGVALVALVLVMLVSAFQRLGLYEAVYGFSRLRTYTHVFLIWIGLLLIAVIALEITRKERTFGFAMLVASFGFAVSLTLLNVDQFIVDQNIARELRGQQEQVDDFYNRADLDSQYFVQLSDDAIPAISAAYQTQSLPDSVREKLGASLACLRYTRQEDRPLEWQSFHLSRFYADKELVSLKKDLDQYKIDSSDWPIIVSSPAGNDFSCSSDFFD